MKKIKYIVTSLVLVSLFSCTFENENPNQVRQEDIRPDQYLPGAMVSSYRVQARTMNILGNRFMQNWYGNINDVTGLDVSAEYTLNLDNSFYSGIWDGLYLSVNNFHQILNYEGVDYDNHKAIAYIMKSYYMQYIVDLYGDCPYTEAFQGSDRLTPLYDNDAQVYLELMNNVDTALALIENADANDKVVGLQDVMYGGNMSSWVNFAKLLKIKLLLRQSGASGSTPNGQSYAAYIQDNFDLIAASGIPTAAAATINPGYSSATAAQQNPLYDLFFNITGNEQGFGTQQTASGYIADFMNGTLNGVPDPRRGSLYVLQSGNIVAANQGENSGYEGITLSKVKPVFPATDSDGVVMSLAEAHFLLAEAYERGYLSGDAQTEFNSGIAASFTFLSASPGTYLTQIDSVPGLGWNGGNHIEAIMTQKWLATNGFNAIESYIDYTRTGFPNVPLATTAIYPNRPVRLPYPLSEFVANSANVPKLTQAQLFSEGPFWKN